jgi:hypothetical protein
MNELSFKKRLLKIKLEEGTYEMAYPTYSKVKDFRMKAKDENINDDDVIDFLVDLGLPREVIFEQEEYVLKAILEELTKKKD